MPRSTFPSGDTRGWGVTILETIDKGAKFEVKATFTPGEEFQAAVNGMVLMAELGEIVVLKRRNSDSTNRSKREGQ